MAALLKYLAFGASEAIVLGWFANCLVAFGSFACGTLWQRDLGKAETGAASFSRGLSARFLAFALLALGILALEESLAGGLVRLGRGEGVYLNGMGFLRFVVVEIDLDRK